MERKSKSLQVRMTEETRRKLAQIGEALGMPDSEFIRIAIEDKYSEISGEQREQVPA